MMSSFDKWSSIRSAIPDNVSILIVSKKQSLEAMSELLKHLPLECRRFGENYQTELTNKLKTLENSPRWEGLQFHFIGQLQTNKIRKMFAADMKFHYIACIETISSQAQAIWLSKVLKEFQRRVDVYLQVNESGASTQSGCAPSDVNDIADFIIEHVPELHLSGLMCLGSQTNPEETFSRMNQLRMELMEHLLHKYAAHHAIQLSMGMSGDYEYAVKNGSDQIRVGAAIMGPRV